MFKKNNIGIWILGFLAAFPVAWWFFAFPMASRFGSVWMIIGTLGKATAIAGFVLFSLNFVLALRVHWLESLFGPLDRVYRIHHMTGGLAFIFLVFHPILLALSFVSISPAIARDFLLGIGAWQVLFGKLSLLVLFIVLMATLYAYKRLGHDRWKSIHKFIGLGLALGVVHAFYVPGEVSALPLLQYYLLGIGLIGLFAYIWRTVLQVYRVTEYEYEFVAVNDLGAAVCEVILKPLKKKLRHLPGQFAFVRVTSGAYDQKSHPFTISSSPDEEYLRFSVKALGDYTKSLTAIAPGTRCRIEGPFGRFSYAKTPEKHQLWVAGGIGVTPFLSMARFFKEQGSTMGYDIDMYYSGKTMEELVFLKELREIAASLKKGFRVHAFDSSTKGHLTASVIAQEVKDVQGRDTFMCGPMAMMDALCGQLSVLGLPPSKIHKEDFALR